MLNREAVLVDVHVLAVTVDRSPQRVVFSVQWAPPARQMLDLEVIPPGFGVPVPPTSSLKTPQASIQAFDMALFQRRPSEVIHHSDQGCQYTSIAFGKRCGETGVRPSMG